MKNKLFVLVGPTRCGKSTLIKEVKSVLSHKVGITKSLTTRPRFSIEDDLFYYFLSKEEFEIRRKNGDFIEWDEHAGNYYAYGRTIVTLVLARKHGICAATEHGVLEFQKSDYPVMPIQIVAVGNEKMRREFYDAHPGREEDDKVRAEIPIEFAYTIENSFARGGLEKATNELINFILTFTKK